MTSMKYRTAYLVTFILTVSMMIFTGCAGSSKPSKFYLLQPLPESERSLSTAADSDDLSILIGPVSLPAYLDRTQLVTLAGNHELVLDEFNRWAEPLQDNFYRVLTENLSLLLNTPEIYSFDRRGYAQTDFQIIIDITRFEIVAGRDAYLASFWTVIGNDRKEHVTKRKSVFHSTALSTDLTEIVDALNRTLTDFSREIASAIRSFER